MALCVAVQGGVFVEGQPRPFDPWKDAGKLSGGRDGFAVGQLADGRVNALVWCAKGDGWEDREAKVPSLDKVIQLIKDNEEKRPQVAVACLQKWSLCSGPGSSWLPQCASRRGSDRCECLKRLARPRAFCSADAPRLSRNILQRRAM